MKKYILSVILLFFISQQCSLAQDSIKVDPSLKGQYQLMLSKSRTLDGYKLINPTRLNSFYRSLQDTLRSERKQLTAARQAIAAQQKNISGLKSEVAQAENSLNESNTKLNEISFLGISFTKSTYNIIVWGLIIVLGLALAITIIQSARHIREAKYRRNLYDEIAEEYQTHKVKANEKEKKLARELQDERNRLEEMKTRGR